MNTYLFLLVIFSLLLPFSFGEECGKQADNALCPHELCCSKDGWCGNSDPYCGAGCQSQCTSLYPPPSPVSNLSDIITESQFKDMLPYKETRNCFDMGFFTYDSFITAAKYFPAFGTTGNVTTRKREVAAFFAQTSHVTTGGWNGAEGGEYAWGYCYKEDPNPLSNYCQPSEEWPCAANRTYYGRGPMMMKWNYNYGPCGEAIGADLLNEPVLVATDAVISFKTALWFWMTPQSTAKPSCHAAVSGVWEPSKEDIAAGRLPGFGVTTNIINGAECNNDPTEVNNRDGFYEWFCEKLGVTPGENVNCNNQEPFPSPTLFLDAAI